MPASTRAITDVAELYPVHALAVVFGVGTQSLLAEQLSHRLREWLLVAIRCFLLRVFHNRMITVIIMRVRSTARLTL